jgi:SAM-dependent methyltransferase
VNPSLIDRASAPYRNAGLFAYNFARGKLKGDPVFRALLERGLLLGRGHILDLGCGQGLLASWLHAALLSYEGGHWPPDWPPAPAPSSTRGIELMVRDVERARAALGPACDISQGDIRSAEFGTTDAVVILDVLHYMSQDEQLQVLKRVRAALPAQGLLLLRIGDADGGAFFGGHALPKRRSMACVIERMRFRSALDAHERGHALRQCAVDWPREMKLDVKLHAPSTATS